jgi:hypothetical protein
MHVGLKMGCEVTNIVDEVRQGTPHHTHHTSHIPYATSYPATSHHATSYPATSYHATSYHATSYPATSYPATSYHATYHTIPHETEERKRQIESREALLMTSWLMCNFYLLSRICRQAHAASIRAYGRRDEGEHRCL